MYVCMYDVGMYVGVCEYIYIYICISGMSTLYLSMYLSIYIYTYMSQEPLRIM